MPGRGKDSMSTLVICQVHPDGECVSLAPGGPGLWSGEVRACFLVFMEADQCPCSCLPSSFLHLPQPGPSTLSPSVPSHCLQHPQTPTWQPLVTADVGIRAAGLLGVPVRGLELSFAGEAPLVTGEDEGCAARGRDESLRTPCCYLDSQQALCAAFVCSVSFHP